MDCAEFLPVLAKTCQRISLTDTSDLVLVCYYEMGFAREVADRVLFVDEGMIKEEGTPEEVFSSPKNPRLQEFLSKVL